MKLRFANLFQHAAPEPMPLKVEMPAADGLKALNADPYLMIADDSLRLISVFDDLRYDRADLDMLAEPMRRRALTKLQPLGFVQRSGSVIEMAEADIRIHLPKFKALGASPFDALRDIDQRPQDYVLLTPTQCAAQILNSYPLDKAMELLEVLVIHHPANLLRLSDFLEPDRNNQETLNALGHLRWLQRKAIEKEPLKSRRALR